MYKKIMLILLLTIPFWIMSCRNRHCDLDVEFVSDPCLIPLKDNRFKLCDNMIIKTHNKYYAVPKGFKTDLASIPRMLWPFFAPSDYDSIAASVLHDWHYCCVADISRKESDDIFYYALRSHGMNKILAYIYYLGVRKWGWIYYTNGEGIENHRGEFSAMDM